MTSDEEFLGDPRSASRRALAGTVVLLAVLAGAIAWNTHRIGDIDDSLAATSDSIRDFAMQADSLLQVKHVLTDAPDGGVRLMKIRVPNVKTELYDHFLWIDASQRSADTIREVRYEFPHRKDSVLTSNTAAAGFAVFFRAPPAPCPDSALVRVVLANRPAQTYQRDFCQANITSRAAGRR